MIYHVIIPEWEWYYVKSKQIRPKYWLWSEYDKLPLKHKKNCSEVPLLINRVQYCADLEGNRFIKNPKKAGSENIWVFNGQDK